MVVHEDAVVCGQGAGPAGTIELGAGLVIGIRPIRPNDGPGLVAFHASLTSWSIYLRYFGAHPELTDGDVEKFTHVDYHDRLALVAEAGGRIVGVGRYDRQDGGTEAEVAFVVADAYQRRGIGALLLQRLASAARQNGIDVFVADVLAENRAMLDVFGRSGFPVHTSARHEVVHVRFGIAPPRAPGSAPATAGGAIGVDGDPPTVQR
ncbi:MAG: GNAT family N-acetyltransferase [Acidimicrobiales bacterium]